MSVTVVCACGGKYELRAEFRNKTVQCPKCGASNVVGGGEAPAEVQDPLFDRELYLLRQKALAINDKYFVSDEQGNPLLFVERPAHLLRNLFALVVGFAGSVVVLFVLGFLTALTGAAAAVAGLGVLAPLVFVVSFVVIAMALSKRRHVTFYGGQDARAPKVLEIIQDHKVRIRNMTYTVRDASGKTLGVLRKNYLYNFFRKQWFISDPRGRPLCIVKEDSIILSLLRRVLGPLFGLLRTNFLFVQFGSERELGEFKRKFTILDRYVLDLKSDRVRWLNRRLAVAAAVMLDTGERR
ncbi:MAG: hypothetical protein ACRENP_12020 [Longimicrobiales bacterium]